MELVESVSKVEKSYLLLGSTFFEVQQHLQETSSAGADGCLVIPRAPSIDATWNWLNLFRKLKKVISCWCLLLVSTFYEVQQHLQETSGAGADGHLVIPRAPSIDGKWDWFILFRKLKELSPAGISC